MYHLSVLLNECIEFLNIKPQGIYADLTFGGGGHTRAILEKLGEGGKVFAFDRDADARANAWNDERLTIIPTDFRYIERELKNRGIEKIDGILADLGVSSHQFDTAERGFSFRFEADLDMRMDKEEELTAALVINEYEEKALANVFFKYGEISNSRKAAKILAEHRKIEKIQRTTQLEEILKPCIPPKERNKYLAQLYQALRIEVNGELKSLEQMLLASTELLNTGGRLVVMSYHSLEDRMVKHFMRSGNLQDKKTEDFFGNVLSPWTQITRKAIAPSEKEIEQNPRARSAKLRVVEKKEV
ncbi:MAG: 16S rRNA (cytosine(1402)-N(4))-methyltransferase RsmH [Bacteroidia bacterium]